jgi:predicted nucleotidyltransferase
VKSIQATDLRKDLFETLDRLATDREPVEVLRFKRPIAVLAPSPSLPATRHKPPIDLNAISQFCKRHNVKSFALFGSILREDFDENSDVDVLVDLNGRRLKFHEECRMLDELEVIFGRKVDMVQAESLASCHMNPHRRASIATTAKVVYDASS